MQINRLIKLLSALSEIDILTDGTNEFAGVKWQGRFAISLFGNSVDNSKIILLSRTQLM